MPTSTWLQVPNTSTCLHVRAYNSYKYLPKSTRLQVPPYKYLLTSTSLQVPAYKYTCLES